MQGEKFIRIKTKEGRKEETLTFDGGNNQAERSTNKRQKGKTGKR